MTMPCSSFFPLLRLWWTTDGEGVRLSSIAQHSSRAEPLRVLSHVVQSTVDDQSLSIQFILMPGHQIEALILKLLHIRSAHRLTVWLRFWTDKLPMFLDCGCAFSLLCKPTWGKRTVQLEAENRDSNEDGKGWQDTLHRSWGLRDVESNKIWPNWRLRWTPDRRGKLFPGLRRHCSCDGWV